MLVAILDLPLWSTGMAIVGGPCVYALLGLLLVRRGILPRLRVRGEDSEFIGAMAQAEVSARASLRPSGLIGPTRIGIA